VTQSIAKYILLLLLLIQCPTVFSQTGIIDSLSQKLEQATTPKDKARLHAQLCKAVRKTDLNKALEHGQQALKIAEANNDNSNLALAYNNIASIYFSQKNVDEAASSLKKAIELRKQLDNKKELATSLKNLASTYFNSSQYDNAIDYYKQTSIVKKELGDLKGVNVCNYMVGNCLYFQGYYDRALQFYTQSMKKAEELGDENTVGGCLNNIGLIHQEEKSYDLAIEVFNRSLEINTKKDNKYGIALNMTNLASCHAGKKEYYKAIEYDSLALNLYQEINSPADIARAWTNMGNNYFSLKQYNKAETLLQKAIVLSDSLGQKWDHALAQVHLSGIYLKKGLLDQSIQYSIAALKIARSINARVVVKSAYDYLRQAYELKKDHVKAYEFAVKLYQLKDSLNNETKAKIISQLETKLKLETKEKEIQLLTKSNEVLEKDKVLLAKSNQLKDLSIEQKEAQQRYLVIFTIIGFAVSILLFLLYRYIRKSNKQLSIAKEKAESSEKIKQQFLANTSHEVRTPIHTIKGLTFLLEQTTNETEQEEYIHLIRSTTNNLLVVINDILEVSKIEAGKVTLEHIEFMPSALLKELQASQHYLAREKGIKLETNWDETIPLVLVGDPVRLRQVLLNLINNALKFTESGTVTITAKCTKKTNDKVTIDFKVTDTGIGISEEKLNTIFGSFSQAETSTTRNYGGTGLGLTIVKQLVELQNGSVSVSSTLGKGSTFSFQLDYPISEKQELEITNTSLSDFESLNEVTALVVDDHPTSRMVTENILNSWGIKTDIASTGKEAIKKVQSNAFDIVFMDIQMPEMDGFEATQNIRKSNTKTPIVALSSLGIEKDKEKCLAVGMNGYIVKPYEPSEVYHTILRFTNKEVISSNQKQLSEAPKGQHFDLNYLHEITNGDAKRMQSIIKSFLEQTPTILEELETGIKDRNIERIREQLHKLQPTLTYVGIAISEAELETLKIMSGEYQTVFDALKTNCENAIIELRKLQLETV
jgi:signal transduction histidine kinase/CheY-like chemotaxis protein/Tfp pilus assembly protein PilF/HPt (histidine-containing phosphotransfer) domain-containing protein